MIKRSIKLKKLIFVFLLLSVFYPAAVIADGLNPEERIMNQLGGYQESTWMMTESDILRMKTINVKKIDPPLEYAKALGKLTIDEFKIGDLEFNVKLLFSESSDELWRVNVEYYSDNIHELRILELQYIKLLSLTYGKSRTYTHPVFGNIKHEYWIHENTNIKINVLKIW